MTVFLQALVFHQKGIGQEEIKADSNRMIDQADLAAMGLDDLARNGQSEARAPACAEPSKATNKLLRARGSRPRPLSATKRMTPCGRG